jgi:hypothetical protein
MHISSNPLNAKPTTQISQAPFNPPEVNLVQSMQPKNPQQPGGKNNKNNKKNYNYEHGAPQAQTNTGGGTKEKKKSHSLA